jgi:hypothetical protein
MIRETFHTTRLLITEEVLNACIAALSCCFYCDQRYLHYRRIRRIASSQLIVQPCRRLVVSSWSPLADVPSPISRHLDTRQLQHPNAIPPG